MTVTAIDGHPSVALVDTHMLSIPKSMSAYIVDGDRPAIIDPGPATAVSHLFSGLEELGIDPQDVAEIVPTHVHLDHAGATGELARKCPEATVRVHKEGIPYLTDSDKLDRLAASARDAMGEYADRFGEPEPVPGDRCKPLADGDLLNLGELTLRAIDAPGHAPHMHCFYEENEKLLFAADAVGSYWGGQLFPATPAPDFDLDDSLETLDTLGSLSIDTLLFAHFGPHEEPHEMIDTYREMLVNWVADVREAREHAEEDSIGAVIAELPDDWTSPIIQREVAGVLHMLQREEASTLP
jgi:glyoxylase-like metal-dependent hydrolase (beta-lactamase superfamily II)